MLYLFCFSYCSSFLPLRALPVGAYIRLITVIVYFFPASSYFLSLHKTTGSFIIFPLPVLNLPFLQGRLIPFIGECYWNQDQSIGCACCYWGTVASRPAQLTEHEDVCTHTHCIIYIIVYSCIKLNKCIHTDVSYLIYYHMYNFSLCNPPSASTVTVINLAPYSSLFTQTLSSNLLNDLIKNVHTLGLFCSVRFCGLG